MDERDLSDGHQRTKSVTDEEDEEQDFSNVGACHPAHNCHRYFFLVFMCSMGIGNYFSYDTPGALQDETKAALKINTPQFALLYALYNWPNVVLSIFGGFLVDRFFGINMGAIIFACFTTSGQILVGIGALTGQFWLMLLGRFVFAIGGENLAVTANMRAVKWFKGKELNMVFGLQLSIARAGSTICFNVMKPIFDYFVEQGNNTQKALGYANIIAGIFASYDLVMAIILAIRDTRAERILKAKKVAADPINIRDVKEFKLDYYTITMIIIFYYVAVFPFISLGQPFYIHKFGFSTAQANQINSVVYFISMGVSPFAGAFIGRLGRNITFTTLSVAASWLAHALLAFTFLTPWVGMIIFGLGYSLLACTVWPMISMVVVERSLGTAYGMTQALQNLGLGVISLAAGYIIDLKGYLVLEVFFLAWISLAVICIMVLFVYNEKKGGVLNMTPKEREAVTDAYKGAAKQVENGVDDLGTDGVFKSSDI